MSAASADAVVWFKLRYRFKFGPRTRRKDCSPRVASVRNNKLAVTHVAEDTNENSRRRDKFGFATAILEVGRGRWLRNGQLFQNHPINNRLTIDYHPIIDGHRYYYNIIILCTDRSRNPSNHHVEHIGNCSGKSLPICLRHAGFRLDSTAVQPRTVSDVNKTSCNKTKIKTKAWASKTSRPFLHTCRGMWLIRQI